MTLRELVAEMRVGGRGGDATALGARDEADAHEERLDHALDRLGLLPHRDGEGPDADGATREAGDEHVEDRAVETVEAERIDVVDAEGVPRGLLVGRGVVNERVVADPPEQSVRDAGCAAAPPAISAIAMASISSSRSVAARVSTVSRSSVP